MKKTYPVSALMPNYNYAKFLPTALDSLLEQSALPEEIIVLDDASTDNSYEIIQKYAQKNSIIKVVKNETNKGLFYNLEKLLELSKGEYICFVSSDDAWHPDFFQKSMELLLKYPEAGLCSSLIDLMDEENGNKGLYISPVVSKKAVYLKPEEVKKSLSLYGSWFQLAVIYRKDIFIKEGGQNPELGSFADGFLNLVIALKYGACFIPEPLSYWRKLEGGYATSTAANVEKYQLVVDYAESLMQSEYKEIFPKDYVKNWRKLQNYRMGDSNILVIENALKNFEKQTDKVFKQKGILDKLFTAILYLFTKLFKLITTAYFMAKGISLMAARGFLSGLIMKWKLYLFRKS